MSEELNAPEEVVEESPEISEEVEQVESEEPELDVEESDPEDVEASEPEAYDPDFSYKVKTETKEFDEWLRPVVKDKETEERLRELYTRAEGLEEVKSVRDQIKEELEEKTRLMQEKDQQIDQIKQVGRYIQKKDYNTFFKALQIPKEDIIRYAAEELQYQEMTPEQQQYIDQQREQAYRLSLLEQQNQQLSTQAQQAQRQQMEQTLESELTRPEVEQVAEQFDSRLGKPGAFREEVIKRGVLHEQNGTVVTANQAVSEVLQLIGGTSPQPQAEEAPQQAGTRNEPVVASRKPVIPNIGSSSGGSPAAKRPRSLEDLRRLRDQMISQQG